MKNIIIKFNGDAVIGIYRRKLNQIDLTHTSGIVVLIDKKVLPTLEKGEFYKIINPSFRILEKCVIMHGTFETLHNDECEISRSYEESIYTTHPVRMVNVYYKTTLTEYVVLHSDSSRVEKVQCSDYQKVVRMGCEVEESPLPVEYQWMLEKIKKDKIILRDFSTVYLSQDESTTIVDSIIRNGYRIAQYHIKTDLPVIQVAFREFEKEWNGQKLFHLAPANLIAGSNINEPVDGLVKIAAFFQGDEPKREKSILTDESREIEDGDFHMGFLHKMFKSEPKTYRHGAYTTPEKKQRPAITRSGNVEVVEFWGRRYAVVYDGDKIDRLLTDNQEEIDKMIRARAERIQTETFEFERDKMIAGIAGTDLEDFFAYIDHAERFAFRDQFIATFPAWLNGQPTGLSMQLGAVRNEVLADLIGAGTYEELELQKERFLAAKKEKENLYKHAQCMINECSQFFREVVERVLVSYVSDQVHAIFDGINALEAVACEGDIKRLEQVIAELKQEALKLPDYSIFQKELADKEEIEARRNLLSEAGKLGIPEYILNAFNGNIQNAIQFMSNVAKIETWRLESNELCCGRARARATCENAWSAMGEKSNFFCGADPNDVKGYVYEHHFGEDAEPVGRKEEKGSYNNNLSDSSNPMEEALRKAGLL
jgi:hypothetical protein